MISPGPVLRVALVTDVFPGPTGAQRLRETLAEAASLGASLAVLPELPLQGWCGVGRVARDEDAEEPGGQRFTAQAEAARATGVALVGGAILRDPQSGRRHNTALVFDGEGRVAASYRKLHLPSEEGFWESDHYAPGDDPPRVVRGLGFPLGVQVCSDTYRPQAFTLLGAAGAGAVLVPRATPPESYPRWRLVLSANAMTAGAYVVSVNRPRPEPGVALGGPSLVIAPDGEVMVETTDALALADLDWARVERARHAYPGYLPVRAEVYGRGWAELARGEDATQGESRRRGADSAPWRVLVLCRGNSARSQMAEGWLLSLGSGRLEATSAGTKPTRVHPLAIRVMAERDVDLSGHRSRHVDEVADRAFDEVITVCDQAAEACPVFPGRVRRVHWSLPDPAAVAGPEAERLEAFRRVRDELEGRIRAWLAAGLG